MLLPYAPWLCWFLPILGSVLTLIVSRVSHKLRDILAVASVGLAAVFSFSMFPDVYAGAVIDWQIPWTNPELGVLIDPLSVLAVSLVNALGFLVNVLSLKYMPRDQGLTRYWLILQFFIGVLALVVVADNLLLLFIGWELVGVCGSSLVAFRHEDPNNANASLKNLMVLRVGDILLLTSLIIIYVYSGTLNILDLEQSTGWAGELSRSGLLLITTLMLLGGPMAKSAQFPLHVRLSDAFPASPAPTNAIIDVSAGTYLLARVLPIFHGLLMDGCGELIIFFSVIALIGAVSTLLGALMAMVQRSLVKILAYAVMSQLAFMWIGLGVGGLTMDPNTGYIGGILHMVMDAIASGALFLTAAPIMYVTGSDDTFALSGLKKMMPIAFGCMLIGVLALIGLPPFNGFWSGEAIFKATLGLAQEASAQGRYTLAFFSNGLYIVLLVMTAVTAFYGVRMLGLTFGRKRGSREGEDKMIKEPPKLMRIPMAVAAVATVATGILAPYFIAGSYGFFSPIIPSGTHLTALEVVREWLFEPPILLFYAALAVGAIPAYQIYVAQRIPRTELLEKYSFLRTSHQFLWNRCYINALYYRVVSSVLKVSRGTYGLVERGITAAISFAAVSVLKVSRGTYGLVERGIKAANQLTANCLVSLARGTYDYLEVQHILRPRVLGLVALAFLGKPFDSQELRTRVLSLSQETYLVTIMFFMALLLMSIILFLIVPSMFGGFV